MSKSSYPLDVDTTVGTVPEHILYQVLDKEIIVLNIDTGDYFDLNESGSMMWSLLLKYSSLDKVMSALLQTYEIDKDTLRRDLLQFIDSLVASGLMEVRVDANSRIS